MKTMVPFKVYFFTVMISLLFVVFFVLCHLFLNEKSAAEIFLSLGSGGVSSTIVALVMDIANKKRQENEERNLFNRLTAEFDAACEELLTEFVVAAQEAYGVDEEKRSFAEWARMLMADDLADTKILREADYALQQVTEVKNQANRLLRDKNIHLNNQYLDDDFVKAVKKIYSYCQRIEREQKKGKYMNCLEILEKGMVDALIEYKPSMSSFFKEPFNWDDK